MSAPVTEAHIARARASGFSTDKGLQMAAQFIANNEAAKAERDQLRAEVKESKERERVAMASWDEELQRALREGGRVVELRAERDQLRADRTYNHECINRLATATGTLGEKSEKVVEVALSTIAELRAERARLDWLEKARPIAWALGSEECGEYWILTDLGEKHPEEAEEFATLRAAIDAAMKEETK